MNCTPDLAPGGRGGEEEGGRVSGDEGEAVQADRGRRGAVNHAEEVNFDDVLLPVSFILHVKSLDVLTNLSSKSIKDFNCEYCHGHFFL